MSHLIKETGRVGKHSSRIKGIVFVTVQRLCVSRVLSEIPALSDPNRSGARIFPVRKVRELRAPLCCCVFPVSPEAPLLVLERVEPPPGRFHLRQSTYAVESQQVNDLHHAFLNLYRNLCISDTPSGQFVLQKHQVIFPEAVL